MLVLIVIVALCGILGGTSYACHVVFRRWAENVFTYYLAYVIYSRISDGRECYWKDIEELYATETNRLLGVIGWLTHWEGHHTLRILQELCDQHPPRNRSWRQLVQLLQRSVPRRTWPVYLGEHFIEIGGAGILLAGMTAALPFLFGRAPPDSGNLTLLVVGSIGALLLLVCALLFLVCAIYDLRVLRRVRHARSLQDQQLP